MIFRVEKSLLRVSVPVSRLRYRGTSPWVAKYGFCSLPAAWFPAQYSGERISYCQGSFPCTAESVLKCTDERRVVHTLLSESWLVHTPVNCWNRSSVVGTWSGRFWGTNVLSSLVPDQVP